MSDLRPTGTPVIIDGKEYSILFTIGAIEAIQEACNKALVETMPAIVNVANYGTDPEDVKTFYSIIAAFLAIDLGEQVTAAEIDGIMKPAEMQKAAIALMNAYGFSMPDMDDEEEDDDDPNRQTGL